MVDNFNVLDRPVPPQPLVPADRVFLAWTMPPFSATTGAAMSPAGTMHVARIRRVPAGTIANITIYLTAGGSTLTSGQCFAALFTAAGAHVRSTADQAAAWATSGLKTMALETPYANAAGDYYVGLWYNGTTGPAIARPASVNALFINAGLASPNLEMASADTGLTTTAPVNMAAQTAIANYYWVALS